MDEQTAFTERVGVRTTAAVLASFQFHKHSSQRQPALWLAQGLAVSEREISKKT